MEKKKSYGSIFRNIIRYKHNSILLRNFGLVVIMMVLPMLTVTMIVKENMSEITQQEIREANNNSLATTARTMDAVIDKMFSFSYYLTMNQEFNLLYLSELDDVLEEYRDVYENKVRFNMLIEEYMDSVYIYLEPSNAVLYNEKLESKMSMAAVPVEEMTDLSWMHYYEACPADSNYVLCSRMKNDFYPYLMTMVYPVRAGKSSRGAVVINVDMRKLNRYLGYESGSETRFYMVGKDGQVYYSNQEELIEEGSQAPQYLDFVWEEENPEVTREIEGATYIVSMMESDSYDCKYVLYTPVTMYEKQIDRVDDYIRNMFVVTLLLGIVVAYIVTVHSFVPIQRIMNEVNAPDSEEEGLKEESFLSEESDAENEISYITRMVKQSRIRNNRFKIETENWMKKLNDAQMVALQSQINPHYLYNTLDMINWDAVEQLGDGNSISDMISALAQFLRIGLERSSYLIGIAEELEHAKLYVKIIEARYAGSIRVQWDIDENILNYKMLRLTLQPLIENAVSHGLRPRRYMGEITVRGDIVNNIICLAVEDNGVGMDTEKCVVMNNELLNHYEENSQHIGIRNVNQRMKILFGDDYGVNLTPNDSGGLTVRMIFPQME